MKRVWVANVSTEACDHYTWVFTNEPSKKEVVKLLMEMEGADPGDIEEYLWYSDVTGIHVMMKEVIDNEEQTA